VHGDETGAGVADGILARTAEMEAIERFVGGIADALAALVLDGAPGIGKTTLWTAGVRYGERRGHHVLQARPTEAEAAFSLAALGDLLEESFVAVRGELPRQQERALAAALLLSDEAGPVDPRTAATATVGVLRLLADERPVLLAVDDAQWLDAASRRILEFAVRRASGALGVLVAVRAEPDDPPPLGLDRGLPSDRVQRITVGPLSFGAVHHLVRDRLGLSLPRPALSRLVTASGGNPYFALELARTLARDAGPLHEPPRLPSTLRDLVASRIDALSDEAREAALVVAASPDARIATLHDAMTSSGEVGSALAEAEAAGVLTFDGDRVRFAHPLLASAAYETASAERRRTLHRRLAFVAADDEARGVHLALSVLGTDAETADAIEKAARLAALRGAHDAAAELFESARRATPGDRGDALSRRFLGGAQSLDAVGEFGAARALAEQALAAAVDAPQRADALVLLAGLEWFGGAADAATGRVEQALETVAGDAGGRLRSTRSSSGSTSPTISSVRSGTQTLRSRFSTLSKSRHCSRMC